ncbi:hypothetical protein QNH46_10365 [Paenibacillus woosongensis]|uniref:DUF4083 domain-containing protein n=1 Tax=Paenibacillus woosongensis TaxID=307580 RepID=A0AA95I806_9BACL|nr:hypothetical protein [Paenibacillus woosongensis]WHX51006.1 hypothetical protein QNH46_10365 [Paenibacillus woosongensis]
MEFIFGILLLFILFGILSVDARLKKKQESDKLLMEKLDEMLDAVNRK